MSLANKSLLLLLLLAVSSFVVESSFGSTTVVGQQSGQQKTILCYWGHLSVHGRGTDQFLLEDIDPSLCTHLVYATIGLNGNDFTLKPGGDEETNPVTGLYKRFTDLKLQNPNLKTLICISGSGNGPGNGYTELCADPAKRKNFTESVLDVLNTYNFDGFDIDWEYPAVPDKENFLTLLTEMRTAFDKNPAGKRLLLTAAVGHNGATIHDSYDAARMSDALDLINVMTYDYHGYTDLRPWTGLNSPLYYNPGDEGVDQHSAFALKCFAEAGADPSKLLMGIAAYGRGFTLADPNHHDLYAKAVGHIGPALNVSDPRHEGYWAYNEYCYRMHTESSQWTLYRNPYGVVPYVVNGVNWFGFDDDVSVKGKAEFIVKEGFGGVMVWTIDQDDFRGLCGQKFGLINSIKKVFDEET